MLINISYLQIDDINLVPNRDYLIVRDGDHPKSPLLGSFTGSKQNSPRLVMSTGNSLYLYFKTSLGETKKGFKIRYSQGKFKTGCTYQYGIVTWKYKATLFLTEILHQIVEFPYQR